ncbi:MAG: YceG family protein [Huintestinicola sp.]
MNTLVEIVSAEKDRLTEDLLEYHSARLFSRGGHFTKDQMIPVYFALVFGCDENADTYSNFLFGLKDDIKKTTKPFAFIDSPIGSPDEKVRLAFSGIDRSATGSVISGLCSMIEIKNDPTRTLIAQKALGDMLSMSRTDMFEAGMALVYKLNLIANGICVSESDEIPLIMYYGNPVPEDIFFLCFAQRCGFDVICVSPDKSCLTGFERCPFADKIQKLQLPASRAVTPFPQKLVKAKIATVAYSAERELDTALYGGDTIFRDRQFDKMDSAVLKTTLDEIFILWDQPSKFRSGFAVRGDRVVVPTIFAKINGVDDGDLKAYWRQVEDMITPFTTYIIKAPSYKHPPANMLSSYSRFVSGTKIDTASLMKSPLNKYGFLSESLQELIFEKMQACAEDGMLELDDPAESVCYIIHAALNLDRSVLRSLQKYDFTKDIPKFVVVDAIEEPFSKLECVQLLLLSYLGFDVLILSPSGYRDIEAYVSNDAFETHTLNEFKYNVSVPRFKTPDEAKYQKQKNGLFKKLFRKGR